MSFAASEAHMNGAALVTGLGAALAGALGNAAGTSTVVGKSNVLNLDTSAVVYVGQDLEQRAHMTIKEDEAIRLTLTG
jgi:hypothetical protein